MCGMIKLQMIQIKLQSKAYGLTRPNKYKYIGMILSQLTKFESTLLGSQKHYTIPLLKS